MDSQIYNNPSAQKTQGCCLCFWGLSAGFTTCSHNHSRSLIEQDSPPYANILLWQLDRHCEYTATTVPYAAAILANSPTPSEEGAHILASFDQGSSSVATKNKKQEPDVSICTYCALFLKDRLQGKRHHKHAMHLSVDYILSGGCTSPPSAPLLERCLQALYHRVDHPFRSVGGGKLHESLLALQNTSLNVPHSIFPCEMRLEERLCVLRWLLEGAQHVFEDAALARNMRRCMSKHGDEWLQALSLPSACRCCCEAAAVMQTDPLPSCFPPELVSYKGVLLYCNTQPNQFEKDIKMMECSHPKPGLTLFCGICCRVNIISYEYHTCLRTHLQLPVAHSPDAYYTQIFIQYSSET